MALRSPSSPASMTASTFWGLVLAKAYHHCSRSWNGKEPKDVLVTLHDAGKGCGDRIWQEFFSSWTVKCALRAITMMIWATPTGYAANAQNPTIQGALYVKNHAKCMTLE